ncbi:ADP-ribosylation factor family-domain-containing protein [Lasiosphaeria miniovina]|uniref:ADP-ribosylation factor family-domain-containing protein n=1 Tax=Lasiosphaeria miniovina TaxID=1954250 RepID=A0AA40A0F9_9PEZI|nr:ADP-ribosylation factor family-domain-containing protein [Lasiosphaeria miniovina]KAK0706992.1 ADP-ribosylation factor family-domain-containing protein [Lasiosphaeria miniovina]
MFKYNRLGTLVPIRHPYAKEFVTNNLTFTTVDLRNDDEDRRLWQGVIFDVKAVIFVVDASASDWHLTLASEALEDLLCTEKLEGVPFVVLGNKADRPNLYDVLRERLHLGRHTDRPIRLFMCSVTENWGCGEAIRWLAEHL